jgi:hypothetical protein
MKELSDKDKIIAISKLKDHNFSFGMYTFTSFVIDYFARVKTHLKMDYDSFMIVQVVVTDVIYHANRKNGNYKNEGNKNYMALESLWDNMINKYQNKSTLEILSLPEMNSRAKNNRLSISSICLILNLPKETVRRKIQALCRKKILFSSDKNGIVIGETYKKIFSEFVPTTVIQMSRMMKTWEKRGITKALLDMDTSNI